MNIELMKTKLRRHLRYKVPKFKGAVTDTIDHRVKVAVHVEETVDWDGISMTPEGRLYWAQRPTVRLLKLYFKERHQFNKNEQRRILTEYDIQIKLDEGIGKAYVLAMQLLMYIRRGKEIPEEYKEHPLIRRISGFVDTEWHDLLKEKGLEKGPIIEEDDPYPTMLTPRMTSAYVTAINTGTIYYSDVSSVTSGDF